MAENYAIEMLHITKRFAGIVANDDITLQLKKGEIHALLGENGAGKSTLMSVLFGLYHAEEGEIRKDGKTVEIRDPNDANDLGIGMCISTSRWWSASPCWTISSWAWSPTNSAFCRKRTPVKR